MNRKEEKRRIEMECLEGFPKEIFQDDTIMSDEELDERIDYVSSLTPYEKHNEIMDLMKEKEYLIRAVEYLKQRLSK